MSETTGKLNDRQRRFVDEYLVDLNATAAYKRAGYSAAGHSAESAAARLLSHVEVAAEIARRQAERSERTQVDQDYVIRVIRETVERCAQAWPVVDKAGTPVMVETPDGSLAPAYKFDSMAVLRGAELLGKHLGMFVEKREVTGKDGKDLVPEAPKGVLVVPGVLDEGAWERMMAKHHKEDA